MMSQHCCLFLLAHIDSFAYPPLQSTCLGKSCYRCMLFNVVFNNNIPWHLNVFKEHSWGKLSGQPHHLSLSGISRERACRRPQQPVAVAEAFLWRQRVLRPPLQQVWSVVQGAPRKTRSGWRHRYTLEMNRMDGVSVPWRHGYFIVWLRYYFEVLFI